MLSHGSDLEGEQMGEGGIDLGVCWRRGAGRKESRVEVESGARSGHGGRGGHDGC